MTPFVVQSTLPLLNDPHHSVRLAVLENLEPPEDQSAYQTIILRCSDESKDVRIGAYRKLARWYIHIPLELKLQILSYGLNEEDKQIVYEFYKLVSEWVRISGSLFAFIDGFIDKVTNMSLLENVIKVYMERSSFLEEFKAFGDVVNSSENLQIPGVSTTHCNIYSLLNRIKSATPSELLVLSVFFQNFADATHKQAIEVLDVFSYLNALVSTRSKINDMLKSPTNFESLSQETYSSQNMPLSQEVYYSPRTDEYFESPPLSQDVVQSPAVDGIARYDELQMEGLREIYTNDYLLCNTLRSLLIIATSSQLDKYTSACELVCNKILLNAPVRSLTGYLLSDMVVSTSLGDNSFLVAQFYGYLKNSYVFHALSLLRRITAISGIGLSIIDDGLGGEIPRTSSMLNKFETSVTHKILSVISDIKDPFQTSGIENVRIGRNELERISKAKIRRFNVSKYSIEHLNIFVKSLEEQIGSNKAAISELETLLKVPGESERESALMSELDRLFKLLEKQELFISILHSELKERWSRILIIVESFLALTRSKCANDPGLQEFPQMILLPQLSFFSSTVIEWKKQDLCDEYCDVLSSKCLGGWSLLNQGHPELLRQIKAFYTAFKESHDVLMVYMNKFTELSKMVQKKGVDNKDGDEELLVIRQRIELQTLRCEMYLATIVDLLITNVELRKDCVDIVSGFWNIVSGKVASTKYIQSVTTRLSCKLVLTDFFEPATGVVGNEPVEDLESVERLRGLLEIAFILPTSPRTLLSSYKFTNTTTHTSFSPEDKHIIVNMACLYPTLSYRHLKAYHRAFEHIFLRSLHGLLETNLPLVGFSSLVVFTMQMFLKAPLHFITRKYANYIKWLLLVTIDEGNVMEKLKVTSLLHNIICMYTREDISETNQSFPQHLQDVKTLSSICSHENAREALFDLRDIRILIIYIIKDANIIKTRANIQVLKDSLNLVNEEIDRIVKEHEDVSAIVEVEAGNYRFKTPDDAAFTALVEAYDAYVSSVGERECVSLIVPTGGVMMRRRNRTRRTYESSSESISSDYTISSETECMDEEGEDDGEGDDEVETDVSE
ncbi:hypothetical protein BEWA_047320 [Theileria equi strain WA]|uniref:Uncharacterized protein n=1 Tax=Theileria equi strain WA TaxID=1537102 RepID=L1LA17_THEEQ|nr:hypothetical protein BEWA_047320 [Theileria equi strain WA]EKX72267.1 hypothetical protein BEWA_047320 [Theileria equi strain WA]|eukprot:XP_004831719.1 hypothetical protein BEWA_047320 [Theileria equi strain WA]